MCLDCDLYSLPLPPFWLTVRVEVGCLKLVEIYAGRQGVFEAGRAYVSPMYEWA